MAMISGCRQVEDNLIDFVERNVSKSLQASIENHLKKCPECARMAEKFSALWEAIPEGERFAPSVSLWPEILDKIQSLDEPAVSTERLFSGLVSSLRYTAVLLLLFLSMVFGFHLGNVPERYSVQEKSAEPDPEIVEEIFVSEYFRDFQDIPAGTIGDAYTSYVIQDPDEES
jgi:hypothetical protein